MRKTIRHVRIALTTAALAFCLAPAAHAGTANGVLPVSANVTDVCLLNVTAAVAFGTYDPTSAAPDDDGVGNLQLTCTQNVVATIQLDRGSNGARNMSDGAGHLLAYELFSDASRNTAWGDGGTTHPSAPVVAPAAPSNAARNFSVYGRIAAGQDVPVASFTDTVNVTVTW